MKVEIEILEVGWDSREVTRDDRVIYRQYERGCCNRITIMVHGERRTAHDQEAAILWEYLAMQPEGAKDEKTSPKTRNQLQQKDKEGHSHR